jgi:hypothetical protein
MLAADAEVTGPTSSPGSTHTRHRVVPVQGGRMPGRFEVGTTAELPHYMNHLNWAT